MGHCGDAQSLVPYPARAAPRYRRRVDRITDATIRALNNVDIGSRRTIDLRLHGGRHVTDSRPSAKQGLGAQCCCLQGFRTRMGDEYDRADALPYGDRLGGR